MYVTNTFLLVSSSVRSKQLLCFVHRQGLKREQKHTTKNFVEFHNHSPLLTMSKLSCAAERTRLYTFSVQLTQILKNNANVAWPLLIRILLTRILGLV